MNYKALLYEHKRLSHLSRELSFNMYNMPSSFIVQSILIRFTITLVIIPLMCITVIWLQISLIKHFLLQEYTFISINKHQIHIATLQWILYRHTRENLDNYKVQLMMCALALSALAKYSRLFLRTRCMMAVLQVFSI